LSESRLQQALADVQLYKALGGGDAPAATQGLGGGFPTTQPSIDMTSLAARTPQ